MKLRDNVTEFKGRVTIFNKTQNVVHKFDNIVCIGFYQLLADRMINDFVNPITHFAVGSSSTVVDYNDTTMNTETFRKSVTNKSSPGTTIEIETEIFGNEAVGVWREIGLLNNSTGGTLTNHTNVDFTHTVGDILTITWEIQKS